jgi:ADP-ribose pyrophosphatase YjhB (NUDIX family)
VPHKKEIISKMLEISAVLMDDITQRLVRLTEVMQKGGAAPGIDSTVGSFASISYRICEAFKTTTTLGFRIKSAIDDGLSGDNTAEIQVLLDETAQAIETLSNGNLVFLGCDIGTLSGHPEVSSAEDVQQDLMSARDQIWHIDELLWGVAESAKSLIQRAESGATALETLDYGPAWELMQHTIGKCMEQAHLISKRDRSSRKVGRTVHPKPNENGKPCVISKPTCPSDPVSWIDPTVTAIFVPGGTSPANLNGIAVAPWSSSPTTDAGWEDLDLFMRPENEPPLPKSHMPWASGVITVEPDGRVWLVAPTNQFGGHEVTYPKGKRGKSKVSLQANAIRECFEESGLKVKITAYLGDFKRSTSITRFYLGERVGGDPSDMGWESQAVLLIPFNDIPSVISATSDFDVFKAFCGILNKRD